MEMGCEETSSAVHAGGFPPRRWGSCWGRLRGKDGGEIGWMMGCNRIFEGDADSRRGYLARRRVGGMKAGANDGDDDYDEGDEGYEA